MIKRRFYKAEHGDNSGTSESSSSDDSDYFNDVGAEEDRDVEEEEGRRGSDKNTLRHRSSGLQEAKHHLRGAMGRRVEDACCAGLKVNSMDLHINSGIDNFKQKLGSGYESEDSSNNQVDVDTSDINEEDMTGENMKDSKIVDKALDNEVEMAHELRGRKIHPIQTNISKFILKIKSVFKCRLCPRILCLSEDAVRAHLSSKRHARSKKLHEEGRLKLMLNSDGELEEEQETHAERHARILALSEKSPPKKKDNGRKRKNERRKKKVCRTSNKGKSEPSIKNRSKKRRTVDT